jgi:hypothetical protein
MYSNTIARAPSTQVYQIPHCPELDDELAFLPWTVDAFLRRAHFFEDVSSQSPGWNCQPQLPVPIIWEVPQLTTLFGEPVVDGSDIHRAAFMTLFVLGTPGVDLYGNEVRLDSICTISRSTYKVSHMAAAIFDSLMFTHLGRIC